jgi:hypothetical protein
MAERKRIPKKPKAKKFDLSKAPRYLVKVVQDEKGNYIKAIYSDKPPEAIETPFGGEVKIKGETPFGEVRG